MPDYQVGDHVLFDDTERTDILRLTAPVNPTTGTITKVDPSDPAPQYTVQREDGSTTRVSETAFVTPQY